MIIKKTKNKKQKTKAHTAFTLIETMVAITVLMLAVIEPMSLTLQSLKTAYYARDQMTASNLAQEAIESVRALRDQHILESAEPPYPRIDMFDGIPMDQNFRIDTADNIPVPCSGDGFGGTCKPLMTDGTLYGYKSGMISTAFVRTVRACYIQSDGSCVAAPASAEVRLRVDVMWRTGSYPSRTITIYEDLYRWF